MPNETKRNEKKQTRLTTQTKPRICPCTWPPPVSLRTSCKSSACCTWHMPETEIVGFPWPPTFGWHCASSDPYVSVSEVADHITFLSKYAHFFFVLLGLVLPSGYDPLSASLYSLTVYIVAGYVIYIYVYIYIFTM